MLRRCSISFLFAVVGCVHENYTEFRDDDGKIVACESSSSGFSDEFLKDYFIAERTYERCLSRAKKNGWTQIEAETKNEDGDKQSSDPRSFPNRSVGAFTAAVPEQAYGLAYKKKVTNYISIGAELLHTYSSYDSRADSFNTFEVSSRSDQASARFELYPMAGTFSFNFGLGLEDLKRLDYRDISDPFPVEKEYNYGNYTATNLIFCTGVSNTFSLSEHMYIRGRWLEFCPVRLDLWSSGKEYLEDDEFHSFSEFQLLGIELGMKF